MNENDFYDKIKQNYDFEDIFSDQDLLSSLRISKVELEKGASTVRSQQYRIEDQTFNSSRIIVYPNHGNGKFPFYKNETYPQDKGDIIQFVANRLASKSQGHAVELLKNNVPNIGSIPIKERKREERKSKPFDLKEFEAKNLTSVVDYEGEKEHFLIWQRKLSQETLEDPLFKDKVHLFEPFKGNKNYKNAFFPKLDDTGEIKGAEIKFSKPDSKGNTNHVEGDPKLLWTSNKPEFVKSVIVVESAIDGLSRHQEFPEHHSFYISTNGNLYQDRLDQIFHICEREGIDLTKVPLIASHDNDLAGFKYDLVLTNKYLNPMESFSYVKDKKGISIKFEVVNDSSLKNLEETKDYFEVIKEKVNLEELKQDSLNSFAKVTTRTRSATLYFPNNSMFEKYLVRLSYSINQKLSFVKSKGIKISRPPQTKKGVIKDWNDYTKKVQMENPKVQSKGKKYAKNRATYTGLKKE